MPALDTYTENSSDFHCSVRLWSLFSFIFLNLCRQNFNNFFFFFFLLLNIAQQHPKYLYFMENECSRNEKHKEKNFFRCLSKNELSSGPAHSCRLQNIKFIFLNRSTGTQNAKSKPHVYLATTTTIWSGMHSYLSPPGHCRGGTSVLQGEFQVSTGTGLTEPMNHRENVHLLPEGALQAGQLGDESGSGEITRTHFSEQAAGASWGQNFLSNPKLHPEGLIWLPTQFWSLLWLQRHQFHSHRT